jgi:hypothetical protein
LGGGTFYERGFFVSGPLNTNHINTVGSSDPFIHFTPLRLTASNFQAVPEPSTELLLGSVLAVVACWRSGRLTATHEVAAMAPASS